jgi:delta 1-pyrroline-5-carboxylate dehydrogenase
VQEDIADKVIAMLAGAMGELKVGDPGQLSTDVGPVIDEDARKLLVDHAARMDREAKKIGEVAMDTSVTDHGTFFAPRAYEIASLGVLQREVFGPILHLIRWKGSELDKVVAQINATGYGLTLGIHSRIDDTIDYISSTPASATATSTATRSVRWSACSRSAVKACPAPAPRPAARTTCCASPTSARSPSTPPLPAAMRHC